MIPGLGRSPGEGNGKPVQCSCLGISMDSGAWWATIHGVARVGHDLVTKPPILGLWTSLSSGFARNPADVYCGCASLCTTWELTVVMVTNFAIHFIRPMLSLGNSTMLHIKIYFLEKTAAESPRFYLPVFPIMAINVISNIL